MRAGNKGATVDTVERLEAIEEIKQLKARYFRCMDTKDWDGFTMVFAPDARMDVSGEVSGAAAESRPGAVRSPPSCGDRSTP